MCTKRHSAFPKWGKNKLVKKEPNSRIKTWGWIFIVFCHIMATHISAVRRFFVLIFAGNVVSTFLSFVCYLFGFPFEFTGTLRNGGNRERERNNRSCRTSKYFKSIIVISFGFSIPRCLCLYGLLFYRTHWCYLVGSFCIHLVRSGSMVTFTCHWLYRWVFFYWGNFCI